MPVTNKPDFQNLLFNALTKAVEAAAQECATEAIKKFEHDLREKISTLGLQVASTYSVQMNHNEVVITLKDVRK